MPSLLAEIGLRTAYRCVAPLGLVAVGQQLRVVEGVQQPTVAWAAAVGVGVLAVPNQLLLNAGLLRARSLSLPPSLSLTPLPLPFPCIRLPPGHNPRRALASHALSFTGTPAALGSMMRLIDVPTAYLLQVFATDHSPLNPTDHSPPCPTDS